MNLSFILLYYLWVVMLSIKKLYIYIITFLIVINLNLLTFGDWTQLYRYITSIISILLFVSVIGNRKIYSRIKSHMYFINIFFILLTIFIILEIMNGLISNQYGIITCIGKLYTFSWLLLIYPLIYIYSYNKGLLSIAKIITFFTIISLVMKSLIWLLFNNYGIDIMHYVLYEFGDEWMRDGNQRIPSTCFSGILFVVMLYLLDSNNSIFIKIFSIIIIMFNIWYANFVFAARSQIITFIICLIIYVLFNNISKMKKVFLIILLFGISIYIINTDEFQLFIEGLSIDTYSIEIRFIAFDYYFNLFKDNYFLGISLSINENLISGSEERFFLSDMGNIGNLLSYGILGYIILILPFIRMIYISIKFKNNKMIYLRILLIYIVLFSLMSNDIYSKYYIFGLPFIWSIFEYRRMCSE